MSFSKRPTRVRIPFLGYVAGCLAGAAFFILAASFEGPMNDTVSLFFMGLFVTFAGGVIAAPLAVPFIILAERKRVGEWWMFLAAGIGIGVIMLGMITYLGGPFRGRNVILGSGPPIIAALTYWFFAWHRNPPIPEIESDLKVFE